MLFRSVLDTFERLGGSTAREAARRVFENRTPEALAEYFRVCGPLYTRKPGDPDAVKRGLRSPEVLPYFERPGGEGVTFDYSQELSRVRCPTLVMGGEEDPITPILEQQAIADALPREWARFERFPHCGHGVWRDDPERAFQVLAKFVAD